MHLVLYPGSFVDFMPSEFAEAPPSHMSHPTCSALWVPRPSAVYVFLLRAIQQYPRSDRTRGTLCNDLSSLILYHLLGYTLEDMAEEDDGEEGEQMRIYNAVGVIRRWGAQGERREGEVWFEDVLVGLVTGHARAEYPPAPEQPSPVWCWIPGATGVSDDLWYGHLRSSLNIDALIYPMLVVNRLILASSKTCVFFPSYVKLAS